MAAVSSSEPSTGQVSVDGYGTMLNTIKLALISAAGRCSGKRLEPSPAYRWNAAEKAMRSSIAMSIPSYGQLHVSTVADLMKEVHDFSSAWASFESESPLHCAQSRASGIWIEIFRDYLFPLEYKGERLHAQLQSMKNLDMTLDSILNVDAEGTNMERISELLSDAKEELSLLRYSGESIFPFHGDVLKKLNSDLIKEAAS